VSSPTPPDSVLLMRALCAAPPEARGMFEAELLLASELGWSLPRLVTIVAAGVRAGYIQSVGADGVRLTDKGRAWCAKHAEDR